MEEDIRHQKVPGNGNMYSITNPDWQLGPKCFFTRIALAFMIIEKIQLGRWNSSMWLLPTAKKKHEIHNAMKGDPLGPNHIHQPRHS